MALLTPGGVQQLLNGSTGGTIRLQVIAWKKLEARQGRAGVRFKLLVSDGQQATSSIVASQLAHLVASGEIREGTIIDIQECLSNVMGARNVIIILSMVIIQQDVPKIGNPVTIILETLAVPAPRQQLAATGNGAPPAQSTNAGGYRAPISLLDSPPLERSIPVDSQDSVATPNRQECQICNKRMGTGGKQAATSICGHVYCYECFVKWVSVQNQCPSCRKYMTADNIIKLYL